MESEDASLKLGGGTQSDKQPTSLEGDSSQEAGQVTAKKRLHSILDSVPSKHMKKITPFDEKGKQLTGISSFFHDIIFFKSM